MYELIDILKIVLAIGIGGVIGIEREKSGKPVGVRTLSLVCAGAAFIILLSENHFPTETAKVIAGIITGIGFLGAGSILAHGTSVKGITTAASIWTVSIIGISIGMGEYILGIFVGLVVWLILIFGKYERKVLSLEQNKQVSKSK